MLGHCACKNITIDWHIRDYSLVPRACCCDFCLFHNAHWVSKAGSRFSLTIRYAQHHKKNKQGTRTATFHQCSNCGDVVAATARIDKRDYGALNHNILDDAQRFPDFRPFKSSAKDSVSTRIKTWQDNWCCPIIINQPKPNLRLIK